MTPTAPIGITRRAAISLLSAVPFAPLAVRLNLQSRPASLRRVVLAMYHALLIDPDGTLKAWSTGPTKNSNGEMGRGHFDPVENYKLYPVPGLANVVAVGAARDRSFAVLADGRVLAWGIAGPMLGITPLSYVEVYAESMGQNAHTPTPVAARIDAVDISVGGDHVLVLARDGTVWSWGEGSKGQLGVGGLPVINFKTHTPRAMSYVPFPVHIPGLKDVVAISAGDDYSLALLKDGTMRAWGGNKSGQLGDGTTDDRTTPVLVQITSKVIAMAASSGMFSVAVLEDGRVLSWGANTAANLGRPWRDNRAPVPDFVPGVANVRGVALGDGHALVLTNGGNVISWGFNALGQLGHAGTATGDWMARPVNGLGGVHSITALTHGNIAVLTDGRIVGWGGLRGRPWISLKDGSSGIKHTSSMPILLNVDGLDNGVAG